MLRLGNVWDQSHTREWWQKRVCGDPLLASMSAHLRLDPASFPPSSLIPQCVQAAVRGSQVGSGHGRAGHSSAVAALRGPPVGVQEEYAKLAGCGWLWLRFSAWSWLGSLLRGKEGGGRTHVSSAHPSPACTLQSRGWGGLGWGRKGWLRTPHFPPPPKP